MTSNDSTVGLPDPDGSNTLPIPDGPWFGSDSDHSDEEDVPMRDADEVKQESERAMRRNGPLVPEDLPQEVWAAVKANYSSEDWGPGPAYHAEYRDARTAVEAYKAFLKRTNG